MTRKEYEEAIYVRMKDIVEIYLQYNPNGKYLSMSYLEGCFQCNNEHWHGGADEKVPIDFMISTREEEDE